MPYITKQFKFCAAHKYWNNEWDDLKEDEKADISARQGVRYPNTEDVDVMDPKTMKPVPRDGGKKHDLPRFVSPDKSGLWGRRI